MRVGAKNEYLTYGFSWAKPSVRIAKLRESVQIIKKLWAEEKVHFNGKYYKIDGAMCNPQPLQKPHPPILIGGCGPKLLRVVAEFGNACNFGGPLAPQGSPQDFSDMLKILQSKCSEVGRDFSAIEKTHTTHVIIGRDEGEVRRRSQDQIMSLATADRLVYAINNPRRVLTYLSSALIPNDEKPGIVGTPDKAIQKIETYMKIGVEHLILRFPVKETTESLNLFSKEVIPSFNQ